MTRPRIVLLTDFGLRDPFVGIMKGVILARAPKAQIVDLCHQVPPQDVSAAALALRAAVPYFAGGSLFVVVVDPGVGSKRRIVWARSKRHCFLAPDNGVLSWLPSGEEIVEWRSVTNDQYFLASNAATFHGRDRFSPVAAALCEGLSPSRLGERIRDAVRLPWPELRRQKKSLVGRILSFDRFGNAVTNIPCRAVADRARFVHRGRDLGPLRSHYAEVPIGRPLVVAGSAGLVELSAREEDFCAKVRARPGDPVYVRYHP